MTILRSPRLRAVAVVPPPLAVLPAVWPAPVAVPPCVSWAAVGLPWVVLPVAWPLVWLPFWHRDCREQGRDGGDPERTLNQFFP